MTLGTLNLNLRIKFMLKVGNGDTYITSGRQSTFPYTVRQIYFRPLGQNLLVAP